MSLGQNLGLQRPGLLPRQVSPEWSLISEQVTSPGTHVVETWAPWDALGTSIIQPWGINYGPHRKHGNIENAGSIPFSTLRCGIPDSPGCGHTPKTSERSPISGRGSRRRSPALECGEVEAPAACTVPARLPGARSASARREPPRPPSCADATRPRPLTSSLPPRQGLQPMGSPRWCVWTGTREGQKGVGGVPWVRSLSVFLLAVPEHEIGMLSSGTTPP